MGFSGVGLMGSPPERSGEHEGSIEWRREENSREQRSDFGNGGDEASHAGQAATALAGLLSFTLLDDGEHRKSAASLTRNAPAAATSVMCRCQPCQERASQ